MQNEEELFLNCQENLLTNFIDDRNNFDFDYLHTIFNQQTQKLAEQNEQYQPNIDGNLINKQDNKTNYPRNQLLIEQAQISTDQTQFYGFKNHEKIAQFQPNQEDTLLIKENNIIESPRNQIIFNQVYSSRESTQIYGLENQETLTYASFHKFIQKMNNQKKQQDSMQTNSNIDITEVNQSSLQNTIDFSSQQKFISQNKTYQEEITQVSKEQETIQSSQYFEELNHQQISKNQNSKDEKISTQKDQKQILQNLQDNNFEKQNMDNLKSNYKLVKIGELGRGGFGSVSIYYDNVTRNKIAVKEFNSLKEYQQEKNILQKIQFQELFLEVKKYTCQLIDFNDYNYTLALEMGFSTLQEAAQILNLQKTGFSIPNLINFLNSMVCFCIELHKIKYYHGDIKPQNIIITINQNSSEFQQSFGICEFVEANIKFIDFGSFSNDVDCYYEYVSAKYKCLFFEEIFQEQQLTWEQILFAEIYSCCKTCIYTMSLELQNEYILFNKSQVDQQNPNQEQKLKLFDFLDLFLTQNPSQNNILQDGISLQKLVQFQQKYLVQNQTVLVQNYYQIDLIQKQVWKKIQTDDFVESQINNQFQQNMLKACSFRNKILLDKQIQLTSNQLNEYSIQDILDNLFLLLFSFDLSQEEFYKIKEINDWIQDQDKYTSNEKISFSLEICSLFQMYQQDSQQKDIIILQLKEQYKVLNQELNQFQKQVYEQIILNYENKSIQFQEQALVFMLSNQYSHNSFLDVFLLFCSFSNLRQNKQLFDLQNLTRYPFRSQLVDWFNKNQNLMSIYKRNIFYYCLIVIDIILLQDYNDTLSIYRKLRQNAKMINKKIEAEIIFLIQFSLLKQKKQTDFASLNNSLAILSQANYKSQLYFYFQNLFQDFIKQNLSIVKQELTFKSVMDTIF
ncbi:kinase domain protein (macronuclear) [Tetrahymena thermophila SB210]|uniref:Kinase domain protein n=1 Tax=Tetrahymena thermophila (strain SB210) TaxID=312017 RepID=Q24GG8_TETTS|nr:kinase domain protein [Tetrahymena thermophila SB210]EAS06903.2 kinase domain protein [Tetrahymena thermophila SB210]|eukprot:XP_001027145.2 kinase domain protein [Tetrahymena thermophila SB210]